MPGGVIALLGGILAVSGFVVARRPDAEDPVDRLVPYQGWIGACVFLWGVWEIVNALLGTGLLAVAPVTWVFWLLCGVADLLVGFVLAFATIGAVRPNHGASGKSDVLRDKLRKTRLPLGLFAIVMGALYTFWR